MFLILHFKSLLFELEDYATSDNPPEMLVAPALQQLRDPLLLKFGRGWTPLKQALTQGDRGSRCDHASP